MDRSRSANATGTIPTIQQQQNHYNTAPPPWRSSSRNVYAEQSNRQERKTQHNKVDSWRSYKDDATNLQTTATPASNLNAMAPSFQPTQNASYYKPYEPLRTSDGSRERKMVEQATKKSGLQQLTESGTGFANRYPVRSNQAQADQPVSSIERANLADLDYFLKCNALNENLESLHNDKYRRATPRAKTPRQTASPPPPNSTEMYRLQAHKEPVRVAKARKLLVILDLNGTLLYRNKSPTKKVYMRPGVTSLLEYLFANHVVMVYTSTMPDTARDMVNQFLHPSQRTKLAALWARDKLDLNQAQYRNKVQVYKKLDKIWADKEIQATAGAGNQWDQSNTILVDDSKMKALAQPHNLLQVLEYTKEDEPSKGKDKASQKQRHQLQVDILKQLELKLEELKYQEDVSRLIRKWQAGEAPVPKQPGQMVSVEENVDQKRTQPEEAVELERESTGRSQLPTPVSLTDGDAVECPMEISDDEESDGGIPLSKARTPKRASTSTDPILMPGLDMLSDDAEAPRSRQSSESSVGEETFQQLLGNDRK